MIDPRVSVVIPVYNEGESITDCLERIFEAVQLPCEVLVVYDDPGDSTAPVLRALAAGEDRIIPLHNTNGPGPANAIRFGVDHCRADVAVVTMADGSDDPQQIDDLVRLVERGVVVAAASRYTAGGQQVDALWSKAALSRLAGFLLYWFGRVGTRDATNSFKAYSVEFVRRVGIHSRGGFEIGLELVAKARRLREPVAELPTIWIERQLGSSRFQLLQWLPHYLRWFRFAFGPRLTLEELHARASDWNRRHVEGARDWRLGVHRRLPRARAARSRLRGRRAR